MAIIPSFNGIGTAPKTTLRITPKTEETTVSTKRPTTTTPSPRGHA